MIPKQTEDSINEPYGSVGQIYKSTIYTGKPFYKEDYEDDKEPWKDSDSTSIIDNGDVLVYDRLPIEVQVFKDKKIGYQIRCKKTGGTKKITLLKINEIDVSKVDLGKTDLLSTYKFIPEFQVTSEGVRLWKNIEKDGPTSFEWLIEDDGIGDLCFREKPEAFDKGTGENVNILTEKTKLDETSFIFKENIQNTPESNKSGLKVDVDYTFSSGGSIFGSGTTYSTARNTATTYNNLTLYVGQSYISTPSYVVYRSFVKFNTSTVLYGVFQVNFSSMISSDTSATDFDVDIVKYNWSSVDPITALNQETAYDGALAGTKDVTWLNTSGKSTDVRYTSPNLDTSWITLSGNTYYALRSAKDFGNTAPTTTDRIALWNTSAKGPTLEIYWSFPQGIIVV